jgi:hypothetical protein
VTNVRKDVEKLEPVGGNAQWYSCYEKQYRGSLKNLKI